MKERFFRDGGLFGRDGIRWWIPLTYTTECELAFNKTKSRKLLPPHVDSISIKGPQSAGDWVFFNIDGSGLYLVDYDEDNWNLIIDFLNNKAYFKQIPPLSRVFLINNAASLAWAGRLNYTKLLDMLKYIIHETHDHPRYAAIRRIDDLNVLLKRTPIHEKFLQYVRGILLKGHRGQSIANMLGEMRRENLEVNFDQRSGFGHIVAS